MRTIAVAVAGNPVRSTSRVLVHTAHAGTMRLTIVDELGREQRVLFDGSIDAGEHRMRLDASGLPSGTYFVRMVLGGQSTATRVVIE
jgi:hypothetical protein